LAPPWSACGGLACTPEPALIRFVGCVRAVVCARLCARVPALLAVQSAFNGTSSSANTTLAALFNHFETLVTAKRTDYDAVAKRIVDKAASVNAATSDLRQATMDFNSAISQGIAGAASDVAQQRKVVTDAKDNCMQASTSARVTVTTAAANVTAVGTEVNRVLPPVIDTVRQYEQAYTSNYTAFLASIDNFLELDGSIGALRSIINRDFAEYSNIRVSKACVERAHVLS
jgi:hypothetical protein